MQCRGARPEFAASVLAKIRDRYAAEIHLGEAQRRPISRRFRLAVNGINKYRHPLLSGAMSVHGAASFARRLYFHTLNARLGCII